MSCSLLLALLLDARASVRLLSPPRLSVEVQKCFEQNVMNYIVIQAPIYCNITWFSPGDLYTITLKHHKNSSLTPRLHGRSV